MSRVVMTQEELDAYLERLRADGWHVACKVTEGGMPSHDEMIHVNLEILRMLRADQPNPKEWT